MALDPTACGIFLTEEELFVSSIGIAVEDGLPFQRLVDVTDSGSDWIECGNDPTTFDKRQLYSLDENGKIAYRVNISALSR